MRLPKKTLLAAGLLLSFPALAAASDRWNLPVQTPKRDNGLTGTISTDRQQQPAGVHERVPPCHV